MNAPKPTEGVHITALRADLEDVQNECIALRADNARLREALHGAMFFVPLGTKARERADSALDSAALNLNAHKGE